MSELLEEEEDGNNDSEIYAQPTINCRIPAALESEQKDVFVLPPPIITYFY